MEHAEYRPWSLGHKASGITQTTSTQRKTRHWKVMESHPEGTALAVAGSIGLLGSTFTHWFSVLVEYPMDESLVRYKIFGPGQRIRFHDYTAFGRAFEVLTVLAGVLALLAILYGSVSVARITAVGNVLTASGVVAVAVFLLSWITFETADPLGTAIGGDARLALGGILAGLSAGAILAAGLLIRSGERSTPMHTSG